MTRPEERRDGVNFSKEISLGNILTVVSMIASMIFGYGKLDTRVSVLEAAEIAREKGDVADIGERNRQALEVKQDLREIRQDIKGLGAAVLSKK